MKNFNIRMNEKKDADILKFLDMQSDKTFVIKKIIRALINQYGYVDMTSITDFNFTFAKLK